MKRLNGIVQYSDSDVDEALGALSRVLENELFRLLGMLLHATERINNNTMARSYVENIEVETLRIVSELSDGKYILDVLDNYIQLPERDKEDA